MKVIMSEGRPISRWFLAAWVGLVIVVAAGFWIQARTIDQLRETQRIQHVLICHEYPPDVLAQNGVLCP